MWVREIKLKNVKGYRDSGFVQLARGINVLVGANNSGKTTFLKSIHCLQSYRLTQEDITLREDKAAVLINVEGSKKFSGSHIKALEFSIARNNSQKANITYVNSSMLNAFPYFEPVEPDNLIYPYLSKRKVTGYDETVNLQATNEVSGNFYRLYAKIDRIANQDFQPANVDYREACKKIIGFNVSSVSSSNGKKAALIIRNLENIPIASMGEGIMNLLGLIVDLCVAENKIFLIEEPENDIHPRALKALLELIEKKSKNNQFIISTHSNIVTKYLGSISDAKVFNVSMSFDEGNIPESFISEVGRSPEERTKVLEDLGYEFHDYDLWKAWLFLEESSAEEFIRDILIPQFTSRLKSVLRTYSARTVSEMEVKFKDFNNLFVFLHLSPTYKNKAWVLVDGGEAEKAIVDKMKEYYVNGSGWNENNFLQFTEHSFEKYYPEEFQGRVGAVLAITDKGRRNDAKSKLLKEVKQWCLDNPKDAKESLSKSAKEVIDILKAINKQIS